MRKKLKYDLRKRKLRLFCEVYRSYYFWVYRIPTRISVHTLHM